MEEMVRNRMLDELAVPPSAGGGAGGAGGGGSLASASASNLLDVAETASEAWSMDVLASDSESLRLGELDNEDAASVARDPLYKIGLPGKLIFRKRKGLWEVLFS